MSHGLSPRRDRGTLLPRAPAVGSGGVRIASAGAVVVRTDAAVAQEVALIAQAHHPPLPDASFDPAVAGGAAAAPPPTARR